MKTRMCMVVLMIALLGILASQTAQAQTFFTDITERPYVCRSVAFGDYDNDGRTDILLAGTVASSPGPIAGSYKGSITLLHNEGNGTFTNRTAAIQWDPIDKILGGGTIFGDYDNDGYMDVYVSIGSYFADYPGLNVLLRNDRGIFRDVTQKMGITDVFPTDNAIWLDYNKDGFLDLYTGNFFGKGGSPNKLYRNNGDGTFTDVTQQVGLLDLNLQSNGGMASADFNNDGWPDLYVGNAYLVDLKVKAPNRLFLNDGKGGFRDATTSVIADSLGAAFGVAVGDINNDGYLDLITGNPFCLYINNGDGTFVDKTSQSGIKNNDSPLAFGDVDGDGFLDMWRGSKLYRNNGNGNHWLRVELVGTKSNRNGIGARLVAKSGDLTQTSEILGGVGYTQDEMVAHFGLGSRTQVDRLEIRWLSGKVDVLENIPANQKIRVIEGGNVVYGVTPTVWEDSLPDSLVIGTKASWNTNITIKPALFEPNTKIVGITADLSEVGGPSDVSLSSLQVKFVQKKQQNVSHRTGSKSEARNPKFETISNDQNPKHQDLFCFGHLNIWI